MRLAALFIVLYGFWLLLSGLWKTWFVVSGAVIVAVIIWFSLRKGVTDREGFPVEKLPRAVVYWAWLFWQMVLSALNVTRIVLDPRLPISPTLVRISASEPSSVGVATYANSITLTPGTLSVEVSEGLRAIWVHAVTRENAAGLDDDPMESMVAWMDGRDA